MSGIISGFVIDPTLLLGFINDLTAEISAYNLVLFANDMKVIVPT